MASVVKIEVYRINAGCPPEHLRKLLKSIESPAEIPIAMSSISALEPTVGSRMSEGGVCYEYLIHFNDGTTKEIVDRHDPAGIV